VRILFGGGEDCSMLRLAAIIAYLLTEGAVGTVVGNFESIDCPLKVEAARML
jgi:hypothetical protein